MAKKKARRGANGLPWLRNGRRQYYVTDPVSGKKRALLDTNGDIVRWEDRLTEGENQDRANAIWYECQRLHDAGRAGETNPVKVVLELYLQRHAQKHTSAKTLADYTRWFQSFCDRWPGLTVRDLTADHIEAWWSDRHPKWGTSMRSLVGSAFKAALNRAAARDRGTPLLLNNPIKDWKLPTMKKRSATNVVSRDEYLTVLAGVTSPRVRDVLEVLWETGTRPINLTRATADHVRPDGLALVFAEHNTPAEAVVHKTFKRTGQALTVPLSDRAKEIVLRLARENPTGPLFRSPRGHAWTTQLLASTIRNHAKKAD
jgi:hypothetical protein